MGSFLRITRQPWDEPLDGIAHGPGVKITSAAFLPPCSAAAPIIRSFFRGMNQWCAVFQLLDRDTQRLYRLYDFTHAHRLVPSQA
jgi:hypothetical protein